MAAKETKTYFSNEWLNSIGNKPFIYNVAEDIIIVLAFYPILAAMFVRFHYGIKGALTPLLLIPALIIMSINRIKSKKAYIYVIIQLAIIVIAYLLSPSLVYKLVFTIFLVAFSLVSFKRRTANVLASITVYQIIACQLIVYIAFMVSIAAKMKYVFYASIICSVLMFLIYILYVNMLKTYGLIKWEQDNIVSSLSNMKSFRNIFVICVVVGTAFLGYFGYKLYYWTGAYKIDNAIIRFIEADPTPPIDMQKPKIQPAQQFDARAAWAKIAGDKSHGNKFLIFITQLIEFAAFLIAALAIIYFLIKLFKSIIKYFSSLNKNEYEERESIFSFEKVIDQVSEKVTERRNSIKDFFFVSNEKKIRKIYYKTVKSILKDDIKMSDTPLDIEQKTFKLKNKNINILTSIYEKFRYGSTKCSDEDVEMAKKISKMP